MKKKAGKKSKIAIVRTVIYPRSIKSIIKKCYEKFHGTSLTADKLKINLSQNSQRVLDNLNRDIY